MEAARVSVAQAEAARRKALHLPNPGLDVSVNTLPVGPLNPPGLAEPFLNVPNVSVGLSVLLELGKRGPRQDATAEAASAATLGAMDLLRRKVLDVEDVIGDVAAAEVRVATLTTLAGDARRLFELQQARAEKGDASALDADRARLELEGTLTSLGEAQEQLAATLRTCAEAVSAPCLPFSTAAQAAAWLDRRVELEGDEPVRRPDVKALEATARSARAAQTLATNGWIPDPTLHVGYVRDQFLAAGNQQNSLFVGLSIPLPFFDHGQDDAAAAGVVAAGAERSRAQLLATAKAQLSQLGGEVTRMQGRQQRLREQSLPLARSIVERLSAAVSRGAAPVQELLLARRSLAELLLTAADLDRALFHAHVSRARLGNSLDALPELAP
jgi:cobalt-zinc-cadmium efflux system outer membrane protein